MNKKDEVIEEIEAEVVEEKGVILSPFKDISLSEGVDLDELLKTYAEVPQIDPEAENAGELYQYVLKGHKAFVKARNTIEKVRKELKAPALKFGKDVDERAKALTKKITDKEIALFIQRKLVEDNEQRKQDEAEQAERDRQLMIQATIEDIKNLPMIAIGCKVATIEDIIDKAVKPTEETCEERLGEAMIAWDKSSDTLTNMLAQAQAVESAEKVVADAKEKADKEEAEREAERELERSKLAEEREEFDREKREFEEAKALREAEDEAEEVEKKELEDAKEVEEEEEEAKLQTEIAKDATENEFYDAYSKGGLDGVLEALFGNKYTYVKWRV